MTWQPAIAPVSVIIPVRGRPELVAEALESIHAGSVRPREILVVVDAPGEAGRPDESAVRRWSQERACQVPLRLLQTDGIGPAGARNAGARQATSEWLAFLDSDDIWHPEKLERQWDYRRRRPHLHAVQTGERWWKQGRWLTQPARLRPRPGRFLQDAWRLCLVSLSSTLIRRTTFFELGAFDESFPACEDFEFWLRYLVLHPLGLVPEGLVTKRSGGWPQLSAGHSLDALRIRAVLKTVREHDLPAPERDRAESACLEKIEILRQGARKRGEPGRFQDLETEIRTVFRKQGPDFALKNTGHPGD